MYILALFPGRVGRGRRATGIIIGVQVARGTRKTTRESSWEQNGLPPMVNIMRIVSAKSRRVREASYQPASMGTCLNISHMW